MERHIQYFEIHDTMHYNLWVLAQSSVCQYRQMINILFFEAAKNKLIDEMKPNYPYIELPPSNSGRRKRITVDTTINCIQEVVRQAGADRLRAQLFRAVLYTAYDRYKNKYTLSNIHVPNAETAKAIEELEIGKNVTKLQNIEELY